MIILQTFGPALPGVPDPSPFVVKAMMLLKIAGLEFVEKQSDSRKAPKKKLPVLIDDGTTVADSTFIRFHIEQKYGFEYDKHLDNHQKAIAWSAEKMCEDHLYWMTVRERWSNDSNFARGPQKFFDTLPAVVRPLIKSIVRKSITRDLYGQGTGRHSDEDVALMGTKCVDSLAALLGKNSYFLGEELCGADATVYAFLTAAAYPIFDSPIRHAIEAQSNIGDYCTRITKKYFPDLLSG